MKSFPSVRKKEPAGEALPAELLPQEGIVPRYYPTIEKHKNSDSIRTF